MSLRLPLLIGGIASLRHLSVSLLIAHACHPETLNVTYPCWWLSAAFESRCALNTAVRFVVPETSMLTPFSSCSHTSWIACHAKDVPPAAAHSIPQTCPNYSHAENRQVFAGRCPLPIVALPEHRPQRGTNVNCRRTPSPSSALFEYPVYQSCFLELELVLRFEGCVHGSLLPLLVSLLHLHSHYAPSSAFI